MGLTDMPAETSALKSDAGTPPFPGTPRWVKVSGLIAMALLAFAALVLTSGGGPHGSGRHDSAVELGGHAGWGLVILLGILAISSIALTWGWLADAGRVPSRLGHSLGSGTRITMPPGLRKLVLTIHVIVAVGSLGSVAVFLALAIAGLASPDAQMVRAAYLAMDFTARLIIVPLIVASLVIGLVQAWSTPWGLLRHYWVLTKFLLTVFTVVVLLQQMDGIAHVAAVAADTALSSTDLVELRRSIRTHAAGGLVVLMVLVTLSIYKPRGMTRHGWRRQHEH